MGPMPYQTGRHGLGERVGSRGPLAGWFLAGQHEAGSVSAGEPGNKGREVLAPPTLWISDDLHRFRKLIHLYRSCAVMLHHT